MLCHSRTKKLYVRKNIFYKEKHYYVHYDTSTVAGPGYKLQSNCSCEDYEGIWGNGRIAPMALELGVRWRYVFSFTPRLLYPR